MRNKNSVSRRYSRKASAFEAVLRARWNAFEDFSAFRSYYVLALALASLVGLWGLIFVGVNEALCYGITAAFVLLPLYYWVSEKVHGLPIYPLYALTFYPTFALQFLINEDISDLRGYFQIESGDLYATSAAVSLYLFSGLVLWRWMAGGAKPTLGKIAVIDEGRMTMYMIIAFVMSALVTAAIASEQFGFLSRLMSILVAANRTVGVVSAFLLAYQWGRERLNQGYLTVFLGALGLSLTATAASLLLIEVISTGVVAIAGFVLGRRKIPWITLGVSFVILYVLHAGKGDMREQYWHRERAVATVGFAEYPAFFMEWFSMGLEQLEPGDSEIEKEERERQEAQNLLERSSLIGVFMSVYKAAPGVAPYLGGQTYSSIPALLLPRFLYPEKPIAHIGQQTLNVHFGIQSEADVQGTFIAWGLFNEAYANYGWWGLIWIGGLIGLLFGWVSHLSAGAPLLSYRGLLSVMTLGFSFQAEMVAGVWVTAYVQSFLILTAVRMVLMKPQLVAGAVPPQSTPAAVGRRPYHSRHK